MESLTPHERYVLQEAVFKRFFVSAEIANFTPNEMRDYRESQKEMWDMYVITTTAEAKGELNGLEKGRAQGLAHGLEQGRAEGEKSKAFAILIRKSHGTDFFSYRT